MKASHLPLGFARFLNLHIVLVGLCVCFRLLQEEAYRGANKTLVNGYSRVSTEVILFLCSFSRALIIGFILACLIGGSWPLKLY